MRLLTNIYNNVAFMYFQSYKATKTFDTADWYKTFHIVFLGEPGKSLSKVMDESYLYRFKLFSFCSKK